MWYAFGETKRVFRMKLYQQRRILLIQTVLDNSSEGIVLVGPDKKIMLYNNKAQNILSITSDMTEENLEKLFGIHPLPAFLCDSESYYNEIIVCKDKKLSVNKFPVHLKDSPVCYVVYRQQPGHQRINTESPALCRDRFGYSAYRSIRDRQRIAGTKYT